MKRRGTLAWVYERDTWDPKYRWVPYLGNDEWGWKTLVLPVPFGGYLVLAFWKCRCDMCGWNRENVWLEHESGKHEGFDEHGSLWCYTCIDCPETDPHEDKNHD